ncbi:ATP-binding protein [Paraglaciecola marina]|uniref:ATP-binding protein n=1 Tax=Paraglaciecola marina TaxID=2500157 RepID=UPI00105D6B3A|nr:ATP-binding protein [Paraglaciecola marina]
MSFLKRVNPANSLFFKMFLWFWLAIFLVFVSSIWLVKQLDSEVKYHPLNPEQQKELAIVTRRLQKQADRLNEVDSLESMLHQASKRSRVGLVLFNRADKTVIYDSPKHKQSSIDAIELFEPRHRSLAIWVDGLAYRGASTIEVAGKEYQLFLVTPRPGGNLRVIRHQYPGLFVCLLILLSGGLCYLFVNSILKPIIQLQNASKKMARGDLTARVESVGERLDEIGQLGRDFNYMSEQVERLLIGQKRLLADISHELRSPLTRLQLSIGIAQQQSESELSADMELALERIEKEAAQIESMISQVLSLSKLDNQQPIQNLQTINMQGLMSPIITDAQFEAEQKGKTVNYQCDCSLTFEGEPQLLSSAVENVLRNAIHYANRLVEVKVSVNDNVVEWTILDDGNGIPDAQLTKIFDAFYRESTARDRDSGGVGLGLAIACQAIAKHKGSIKAANRPEGGLAVTMSIPIA